MERRKQYREMKVVEEKLRSDYINGFRNKQRSSIKQELEIEREQVIAQQDLYKTHRKTQWKKRLSKSPYHTDLVADTERIQEQMRMKTEIQAKKKVQEYKKLADLKSTLIMNQLLSEQQNAARKRGSLRRQELGN